MIVESKSLGIFENAKEFLESDLNPLDLIGTKTILDVDKEEHERYLFYLKDEELNDDFEGLADYLISEMAMYDYEIIEKLLNYLKKKVILITRNEDEFDVREVVKE